MNAAIPREVVQDVMQRLGLSHLDERAQETLAELFVTNFMETFVQTLRPSLTEEQREEVDAYIAANDATGLVACLSKNVPDLKERLVAMLPGAR